MKGSMPPKECTQERSCMPVSAPFASVNTEDAPTWLCHSRPARAHLVFCFREAGLCQVGQG